MSDPDIPTLSQSPRHPEFLQDPYAFYARARAAGPLVFWKEYGRVAATDHATINALLRDRRLGRQPPDPAPMPAHLAPFEALERHSLLELEPPRHTALRNAVLRDFTSRRIAGLRPDIAALTHQLIDAFGQGPFDLLPAFAETLPVTIIARMLGVPPGYERDLLDWSHALVAMYQARRDRALEDRAAAAAEAFSELIRSLIAARRKAQSGDLLSALAAHDTLTEPQIIATAILLLNAGHEATVHTIGNGIKAVLDSGIAPAACFASETATAATVEEILRFDPPLHKFSRYVYEPVEIGGTTLGAGREIDLLLGSAGRDPMMVHDPERFDPARPSAPHLALGAGLHFCLGAPLARAELQVALPILFARCPNLRLTQAPTYADRYHFHGLERLMVATA